VAVPVGPPDAGGVLLVADERLLRPDPTTVNLMELLAGQAWPCLDRLRTLARLREQASSDPLTGLRHTGPFGQRIATATPGRTALLAIDVDGFKDVNDTYGHQAGDRLLVGLARALEEALRHGDELYRIGGDEFVAVIEVNRPEEAVRIAERLTEAARRTGRTISVGVALPRPGESAELTLRRADQALYAVKRHGRDGVRLAAA
jgi:diguanylate cyclase (GGDEF)-like protein